MATSVLHPIVQEMIDRFTLADNYRKNFESKWLDYYEMYRAHAEKKEDRANYYLAKFFQKVHEIAPKIYTALYDTLPVIKCLPLPKSTDTMVISAAEKAAQANEQLLDHQWNIYNIPMINYDAILKGLLYGNAFFRVGLNTQVRVRKESTWTDPISEKTFENVDNNVVDIIVDELLVECIDILDLYIDPKCKTLNDPNCAPANFLIYRQRTTWPQVQELMRNGVYLDKEKELVIGMPSETDAETRQAQVEEPASEEDSHAEDVELLHYWKREEGKIWYYVIANRREVILEHLDPLKIYRNKFPLFPFIQVKDYIVPDEIYGMGEGDILQHPQHEINTLHNMATDNMHANIFPRRLADRSLDIDEADFVAAPGKLVGFDLPVGKDLAQLYKVDSIPDLSAGVVAMIEHAKAEMEEISGVHEVASGKSMERRETATTVLSLQQAAQLRFDIKIRLWDMALAELAFMMTSLNRTFLDREVLVKIVGENGEEWKKITAADINGQFLFRASGTSAALLKEARKNSYILAMQTTLKDKRTEKFIDIIKLYRRFFSVVDVPNFEEFFIYESVEDMIQGEQEKQNNIQGMSQLPGQPPGITGQLGPRMIQNNIQGMPNVAAGPGPGLAPDQLRGGVPAKAPAEPKSEDVRQQELLRRMREQLG